MFITRFIMTLQYVKTSTEAIAPQVCFDNASMFELRLPKDVSFQPGKQMDIALHLCLYLDSLYYAYIFSDYNCFKRHPQLTVFPMHILGGQPVHLLVKTETAHPGLQLRRGEIIAYLKVEKHLPVVLKEHSSEQDFTYANDSPVLLVEKLTPSASYYEAFDGVYVTAAHITVIQPKDACFVSTDVSISPPEGYVAVFHPLYTLEVNWGLRLVCRIIKNRTEVKIKVFNCFLTCPFTFTQGERLGFFTVVKKQPVTLSYAPCVKVPLWKNGVVIDVILNFTNDIPSFGLAAQFSKEIEEELQLYGKALTRQYHDYKSHFFCNCCKKISDRTCTFTIFLAGKLINQDRKNIETLTKALCEKVTKVANLLSLNCFVKVNHACGDLIY